MKKLRLQPVSGDKFIGRPQGKYEFSFTVIEVEDIGVHVVTDRYKVIMLIPPDDWNKHVAERTITKSTGSPQEAVCLEKK